ncbi:hypothetical protein PIB30_063791 [Stylosanthes scabra]|uniref:Uncharacterized protein n=1 Tax=Stylosanthes scabra TaxID=79078 RepID=A0ABU6TNQ2_9FABA|nr:hypothetical protein [Stylosanthes scabra]
MAYRIPHAVDVGKWQLVDVDDDIACIFDMHAVSGGFRTLYLYVEPEMGENLAHTPFVGRTINTQSSQASAQRGSDNSTPNPTAEENPTVEGNPPTEGNPLMKDILSDISDHEDKFLNGEQEDEDIAPDQPFEGMHGVGDVAGHIVWTPYAGVIVPDFCTQGAEPNQLHSVTLSGRTDEVWHVTHAAYIHRWDTRRERIQIGTTLEAPLTCTSEYMKWYRRNTRRWIGRSLASLGQVFMRVDMVEQLHISSSTPPPNFTLANVHQATRTILDAFGEHDHTLLQQISQPAPPSQTLVQPPPEEDELGGSRARRRRTGLAANRTRLRDDESSSSSSHGTQSSTPASTGPPPHPPQHHFPQHPFSYPGYLVYPIPPPHTGAHGSSSSSTTVPPFPPPFPFP